MTSSRTLSFLACFLAVTAVGISGMGDYSGGETHVIHTGDVLFEGDSFYDPFNSPSTQGDVMTEPRRQGNTYVRRVVRTYPSGRQTTRIVRTSGGSSTIRPPAGLADMIQRMMTNAGRQGSFSYSFTIQRSPGTTRTTRLRQPGSLTRRRVPQTFVDPFRFEGETENPSSGVYPPHSVPRGPSHGGRGGSPGRFGVNRRQIQKILDKHNSARRELGAADMYALRWDDQLAKEANDWIQQCSMTHQQGGRGENLAMMGGYGVSYNSVIDYGLNGWYQEKQLWNYGDGFSSETGHYTQMIWASTRFVGCAAKRCGQTYYFFCFYSPQGNIMGRNPYTPGRACSACRGTCRRRLCT